MDILLNNGLNLSDPLTIKEGELAIAQNVDFRHGGALVSRDGRSQVYTSQGTGLIGSADGDLYTVEDDLYRNGSALSSSITGPSALGRMALYNTTTEALFLAADNGNKKAEDDTVYTWGIAAPSVAATLAVGAGTGLTGTYYVMYTYIRKSGSTLIHESNPSPVSPSQVLSNEDLSVTWTASSDTQVTHVRIYRTVANGNTADQFFDQDVAIGSTQIDTSTADTALGTLIEVDNDVPPANITAIGGPGAYNRLFLGVGNKVYFTKSLRPESVPSTFFVEVGVPFYTIQAILEWGGLVYIFTRNFIYYLQGTTALTFYPGTTMAPRGLEAKQAIAPTSFGIFHLSYDGLWLFNGQTSIIVTEEKVHPLFHGETVNGVSPINTQAIANCWLVYFKGKLFLGYPDSNETIPNKVLVYDLTTKKFAVYDYRLSLKSAFVDRDNQRLLAGDTAGTVWELETGSDDAGSSFPVKVRSKELSNLATANPRYVRYDITNPGGNTITSKILSQGALVHTHTITDSKNHKRRYLPQAGVDRLSIELESDVTSKVEIGSMEIS